MISLTIEKARYFTMGDGITGIRYLYCTDNAFGRDAYIS